MNTNNENVGRQSFVSRQPEAFIYDKGQDANAEMKQSQPDKFHGASSAPLIGQNEQSGYHHPFDLLVRGHTQEPVKGVAFPTMSHLKEFIENMKRSFLVPGSDLSRHFETAREKMKTLGTPMDYGPTPDKGGTASGDSRINNDRIEEGANYQMPNKRLSFPDPFDSSASLISSSVYDNQKFRPGTTFYPHDHLAATGLASRNLAHGFPWGNNDLSVSVESERHKPPEKTQFPSSSFHRHGSSYSEHVTAPPVNPANSPSQDFSQYSSETSNLTPYWKDMLKPVHASYSRDPLMGYWRPPGGFELTKDFHRASQTDVPPAKNLPSAYSYGKKHPLSMQHYWPKYKTRIGASVQPGKPTDSKELRTVKYASNIHWPPSGSVSLSFNDPLPQWRRGHMGYQRSPQYPQIPHYKQKQMDRARWMFTAKPLSFVPGYQKVSAVPFVLNAGAKHENSNLYNQELFSAFQKPHYNRLRNPPQSGLTSYGVRNTLGSFSKPQRQTVRSERLRPFMQSNRHMPRVSVSRRPRHLANWPSEQQPKPTGLMPKCVIKRNTKSLLPQESRNTSPSSPYVKSKNRFTRVVAYLSKVCFTPRTVQGKSNNNQWRLVRRWHE